MTLCALVRSLLMALLALPLLAGPLAAQDSKQERLEEIIAKGDKRYALLVGVGDYTAAPDVKFVKENLDAIERLMEEQLFVPRANIVRIEDPDNITLGSTFGFREGEPGDFGGLDIAADDAELYVYFVGHGSRDLRASGTSDAAEAEGFILAANSRPAQLTSTAYSYDTLVANLDAYQKRVFPEGRVILFMESCFSGETNDHEALNPSMSAALLAPEVGWDEPLETFDVVAIAAAGADTPAYWDEERERGLFTDALVSGLSGLADRPDMGDGDGMVTVAELGSYLRQAVSARARTLGKGNQQPQVKEADQEVVLASVYRSGPVVDTLPDDLLCEFEMEDAAARLAEADKRDLPALQALARDTERLREECGAGSSALLARLIIMQDEVRLHVNRCEAAATIAQRWQERDRFDRLLEFDQMCAPSEMVEACVASRDAASRACTCLRDPGEEACRDDPKLRCQELLDTASAEALAAGSLDPLTRFERDQVACIRGGAAELVAAREAVCEAAQTSFDDGAIPAGVASCPYFKELAMDRAKAEACADAFQTVRRSPEDYTQLATFLAENGSCEEAAEARVLVNTRIAETLAKVDGVSDPAERTRLRTELIAARSALEGELTPVARRGLDDAITSLDETSCPVAYRQAARSGNAALATFVDERPNCPQVAEARQTLAAARCRSDYARVSNRDDPAALFTFVERNPSCTAEITAANTRLNSLATQCIHKAGGYETSDPRRAISEYRRCDTTFGFKFDWVGEDARARLDDLKTAVLCSDAFGRINRGSRDELLAFVNGFKAECRAETEEALKTLASLAPPEPEKPRFDGSYTGVRGYTERNRRSPNKSCLGRYNFTAQVRDGRITFHSDGRSWTGAVGPDGRVTINRTGVNPPTKTEMWITADINGNRADGKMYSGFCGEGYFSMTRR